MPTAYNRQLKDKDDNLIYPVLNSDSIPGNAVTTAKINDGAVTNAKIGAEAVKAANIDFATMSNYDSTDSATTIGTTATGLLSLTVSDTGTYCAIGNFGGTNSSGGYLTVEINKDGTVFAKNIVTLDSANRFVATVMGIVQATSGSHITLTATASTGSATTNGRTISFAIIRVA